MDYFRRILTTEENEDGESAACDTIEKLVDRLSTATLLDDRRDAIRALKSLSKKFRLEVGTQALYPLLNLLIIDREDNEIVSYSLEILCNVMNEDVSQEVDTARLVNIPTGLGCQFTEMFISKTENMELSIMFLEDPDFYIKRLAIQLISICLINMHKETQDSLLKCPMAISKIVDLLSDSREVVRNDSLLMMINLVRGNTTIQKIVAFESAYDKLLTIISEEGDSDGDVIVEDCLKIIVYLVENNSQNQTLFKEGSYIKRLTSFFEFKSDEETDDENGWSAQKLANVQLMLQVVRSLVSPHNKSQSTFACQNAIRTCGLFDKICEILMSNTVPPQLLNDTVLVVGEIMRGCTQNQDLFSQLMSPSQPPQPAINVLLLSMVNESLSFILRCSVLYCFQCYLHKNQRGQEFITYKLLPTTSENRIQEQYSVGRLLCRGLFSTHTLSTWFAAVSLMHAINNNCEMKEELLKAQLTDANSKPISLLQRCTSLLTENLRPQAKIGILMLLCTWLSSCPAAVTKFISANRTEKNKNDNISFLISVLNGVDTDDGEVIIRGLSAMLLGICIKYNNNHIPGMDHRSILQTIERRMDIESFIECLNNVTKSESYTNAMRHLQPHFNQQSDAIFDYEFTRLFRSLEHEVLEILRQLKEMDTPDSIAKKVSQFSEHESVVNNYKELIKNQDQHIQTLRMKYDELSSEKLKQDSIINNLKQDLQTMKDQCSLLRAKKAFYQSNEASSSSLSDSLSDQQLNNEVKLLQDQLDESRKVIQLMKDQIDSNENINDLEGNTWKTKYEDLVSYTKSLEDNRVIGVEAASSNEDLHSKVLILENQMQVITERNNQLELQNENYITTTSEFDAIKKEFSTLKIEHDDLLVLLSDQEETIRDLKSKLGLEISDGGEESSEGNVD